MWRVRKQTSVFESLFLCTFFCRRFPIIVHSGGAEEREKHLISVDNRRVALQDRVVSIFSALRCSEVMCSDQTRTHSTSKPIRGQGRLKQDLCNYIPYSSLQAKNMNSKSQTNSTNLKLEEQDWVWHSALSEIPDPGKNIRIHSKRLID